MNNADPLKPVGVWEVRRTIKIPALRHEADAMGLVRTLEGIPGVRKAEADAKKRVVVVRYDATESDYQSIVAILESTGYPVSNNWRSNIKGSWYQYTDTNARDNAHAPPAPCCNKPPKQGKF